MGMDLDAVMVVSTRCEETTPWDADAASVSIGSESCTVTPNELVCGFGGAMSSVIE